MRAAGSLGASRRLLPLWVFLGALLLFGLEPLVGGLVLPQAGGAFHVWTTSLMFFQGALFLGYLYAHLLFPRLGRAHLLALLLPLLLLPLEVEVDGPEVPSILLGLARGVALPFAMLATTAVVAQRWWSRFEASPYRLYALSNAGSLGALLGYALLIQPWVTLTAQRWAFSVGYGLYLLVAAGIFLRRPPEPESGAEPKSETIPEDPPESAPGGPQEAAGEPISATRVLYWLLLSAAPSAFLMGVTNVIAADAGNVPLVWVLPLALYLGTFVLAFSERDRVPGAVRRLWPHIAAVGVFFYAGADSGSGLVQLAVHLAVLFVVALAAHAELYRVRPAAERLTAYYLALAAGGWIGGAAVALAAPALFDGLYEYPLALLALALAMGVARRAELRGWLRTAPKAAIAVSLLLVAVMAWKMIDATLSDPQQSETLEVRRSDYGLYRVRRFVSGGATERDLVSGITRHGRQREGSGEPLSYYHREGPLGDAIRAFLPRRWAVVGLGVGAASAYLREGEALDFYEIDPVVTELARRHFTFLAEARGRVRVLHGDARLTLRRRRGGPRYALMLIDAFSGDAVPTHLLTVEAIRLYRSRLSPGAPLLFHVSNRYYDLVSVVAAAARAEGLAVLLKQRRGPLAQGEDPSEYVALHPDPEALAPLREAGWVDPPASPLEPWTDERANTLHALYEGWRR